VGVDGSGKVLLGGLTIEECSGFLEGKILGLDDEEVEEDKLEGEPAAVDNVVLPGDGTKSDGVNVLVEDKREGDTEVEDVEALGTECVGQDLNGVGDNKGSKCDIVSGIE